MGIFDFFKKKDEEINLPPINPEDFKVSSDTSLSEEPKEQSSLDSLRGKQVEMFFSNYSSQVNSEMTLLKKDLEILIGKIETLKAMIEMLDTRLKKIEETLQSQKEKRFIY
ncbi:MAG: hypothetical protein QXD62_02720 [Candidatus Woesearchaeota archaeon]